MSLDAVLDKFPREVNLKGGITCLQRPLDAADEQAFHAFFLAVPERERMFIKHRVTEPALIQEWCRTIDLGRNFPLLAMLRQQIIGVGTLHQQLGGWKRHIGRVSVLVHPQFRGRGLARELVTAHGGTIGVTSSSDQGTIFTVRPGSARSTDRSTRPVICHGSRRERSSTHKTSA